MAVEIILYFSHLRVASKWARDFNGLNLPKSQARAIKLTWGTADGAEVGKIWRIIKESLQTVQAEFAPPRCRNYKAKSNH